MARPTLTVIVDHEIVSRITLAGPVTLGRLTDNSLVLPDKSVSGHHGRFDRGEHGWRYTDTGSSNGSMISAGPLLSQDEYYSLRDVTQIMVGATILEFDPNGDVPESADPHASGVNFKNPPSSQGRTRDRTQDARGAGSDPTTGFIVTHGEQLPSNHAMEQGAGTAAGPLLPAHRHQGRPQSGRSTARSPKALSKPRHDEPPPAVSTDSNLLSEPKTPTHPIMRPGADWKHPAQTSDPESERGADDSSAGGPPVDPSTKHLQPKTRLLVEPAGKPRILVVLGDEVTTVELEHAINVLGRSQGCDVIIDDASVSSRHAEISYRDGSWMLRDLGSTNGTRLGLVRIEGLHEISSSCHLILGAADLMFVHDAMEQDNGLDAGRFLRWLRNRREITRNQARNALVEASRSGRGVGEILVSWGILKPGSLTELSHNAALGPSSHGVFSDGVPSWVWATLTLIAAAAAWVAFS